MKSLAFFNNKGGVGKTTLACNTASYMSTEMGLRVVVIDCDPQANATQLLLEDDAWEQLYEDPISAEEGTVLRALRDIRAGDSTIDAEVQLIKSARFQLRVLAGHPSLSTLEDRLSASWVEFRGGVIGGLRRSLWARTLTQTIDADLVVFDLGPSLGALNRSVLLGSDYFVTPVAADLFSLYALENIGDWLAEWLDEYSDAFNRINSKEPEAIKRFQIPAELAIARGYVGYTVQQYVTRNARGKGRGVAAYDRYRKQIPERAARLDALRAPTARDTNLGVVPNMFSMVPLAQNVHAPISALTTADGVRGAQVTQQARYASQLADIFTDLASNIGYA